MDLVKCEIINKVVFPTYLEKGISLKKRHL